MSFAPWFFDTRKPRSNHTVTRTCKAALMYAIMTFGTLAFNVGDANAGDRRVAFVVGNSGYQAVPQLPNPRNDANAVTAALRKSGFEVITAVDVNHVGFDGALEKFLRSLSGADLSVFYYSGHGIQVGGDNRIVPTDATLKSESDLEVETISVKTIMSYMRSNSKLQLVFLDSCRNNPFPGTSFLVGPEKQVITAGLGLAPQESPLGTLVSFSTQPGAVAIDGTGDKSPFTQSMLSHSFKLGVDINAALEKVTDDVWQATSQKQKPWLSNSLGESVFLKRPAIRLAPAWKDQVADTTKSKVKIAPAPKQDQAVAEAGPLPNSSNQVAEILSSTLSKPQRVPIGVGQVAMLDTLPIVRAAGVDQIEITNVPSAGILYLDGKPLGEGDVLNKEAIRQVKFEPAIDSNAKVQEFGFKVSDASGGQPAVVNGKIEPFIVSCDEEAGEPLDLQGVSPGKLPNEINPETAIAACSDALAKFPNVPRYKYELGRAKLAAKDTQGALELFRAAADAGHFRAYNQMGYMTQYGFGRAQNMSEANHYYKMAADQGDPYGMLSYGRALVYGRGMDKDLQEGTRLLNKSVELGHTFAMNELGAMYFYGRNVKLNPQRGLRFWEAGLARNDIYSIRNIGLAYLNGKGVKKDYETALAMFRRASDGGHPNAATDIGAMYYNGTGVKKNLAQAIEWYETGAERGDAWSASNLAFIFSKGPHSVRDMEKAVLYSGLSVALDRKNEIPKGKEVLKSLPAEAKRKVIKTLITQIGAADAAIKEDLDETLVSLSTQAWQARNPRYDLL